MKSKTFSLFLILCFLSITSTALAKKSKKAPKPVPVKISVDVVNALEKRNLEQAGSLLMKHPASNKTTYLLRQVTRILLHEGDDSKPTGGDSHQYYKNIAISYHNLFLFLKSRGIDQSEYYKKALKYYKKSKGSISPKEKQEIQILTAALYAANGDLKKANKLFEKYDDEKYGPDLHLSLSIASYYAAVGNVEETILNLKKAHSESPETVMNWMAVGDDFYLIRDDPQFIRLLQEWQISKLNKEHLFSLPKREPLRLRNSNPPLGYHSYNKR
jgi:hypothetical protein